MLTHPTLDQLRALRLDGMVQAFIELEAQQATRDLAHAEWLALLLDREAANRNTRRFQIRLRAARLRHSQAAIEYVDYRIPASLRPSAVPAVGHLVKNPVCPHAGPPTPCGYSTHTCFQRRQLPAIRRGRAHKLWWWSTAS